MRRHVASARYLIDVLIRIDSLLNADEIYSTLFLDRVLHTLTPLLSQRALHFQLLNTFEVVGEIALLHY